MPKVVALLESLDTKLEEALFMKERILDINPDANVEIYQEFFLADSTSDIITEIDGTPIHELSDLDTILDSHKIGDVVELTVVRGPDYDHTFAVKLELVSSKGQEEGSGSFFENP